MSDHLCPRCGKPLKPGATCADCARPRDTRRLGQQPLVFVGVVAIAVALWMITYFLTHAYIARQDHLARDWFRRGESDLQAQRLDSAVSEFRNALAYSHDNFAYRLRLAQALLAAHQWRPAQAHLLALWDQEPGNGTVNRELARLAAARGDFQGAVRYYHGAIYGLWDQNPVQQRREAHMELVQFLLQHKATQQAEPELIALAADLPRDPALLARVGALFREAGLYERALREYQVALALVPRDAAALAGAGEAAFQLGRYDQARSFLHRAVAANPKDAESDELLRTSELVLELDPFARRLSTEERSRRVARALQQARSRVEQCAEKSGLALNAAPAQAQPAGQRGVTPPLSPAPLQPDYSDLLQLEKQFSSRELRRNPDLADTAMDLVFRAERDAAQQCGAPTGADSALLLLARQREVGAR